MISLLFTAVPVSAHNLLPNELKEYLQNNPGATTEELQDYIAQNEISVSNNIEAVTDTRSNNLSLASNSITFIKLGVEHIVIGWDHILFVLALVLISLHIKQLIKMISAFTIAHTITFLLAGSSFFSLSSSIVEPLIALSIAYVAFTSVYVSGDSKLVSFLQGSKNKVGTVFVFGLFHGLGFAGLLEELAIPENHFLPSLISFNIGIELGQVLILLVALPIFLLLKKKTWYSDVRYFFSAAIIGLSLFWFVERLF